MSSFPLRAAVLAIAGAILGSVLWILIAIAGTFEHSYPAVLVGVFAGAATRLAPDRGPIAQMISLVATLVGMLIVQYFVVRYAIVTDRIDGGLDRSAPLLLAPDAMWRITFGWLRVYPLNIASWVVSAAAAFLLPAGRSNYIMPSAAFLSEESEAP